MSGYDRYADPNAPWPERDEGYRRHERRQPQAEAHNVPVRPDAPKEMARSMWRLLRTLGRTLEDSRGHVDPNHLQQLEDGIERVVRSWGPGASPDKARRIFRQALRSDAHGRHRGALERRLNDELDLQMDRALEHDRSA
jgi:hypothetical protein